MSTLIELEPSHIVPQFNINNESIHSIDAMRSGMIFDYNQYIASLQPESVHTNDERLSRSKDVVLIRNYIKSFLSDTNEIAILQTVLHALQSNHQNKESILVALPTDVMSYIVLFVTIEEYAFNILPISKHFYTSLTPYAATHIMRDMIRNECVECWLYTPLMGVAYMDEWELCGASAWSNIERTQLDIPRSIKNKSLLSTLFLLHFIYKCRYGGIKRSVELRQLLLQLISIGGGILGVRYMIFFYCKQFLFDRIQYESDHNIPILNGQFTDCKQHKATRTIADLLYEIYDDETFFRFTYGLRTLLQVKFDCDIFGDVQFYNLSSIYGFPGVFNNIKSKYGIEFDETEICWKTAAAQQ
eukprot:176190_1